MGGVSIDAAELFRLAMGDPHAALAAGPRVLAASQGAERALALRALGVAHRRGDEDLRRSRDSLEEAIELASEVGDRDLELLCIISLAPTTLMLGDGAEAVRSLGTVCDEAEGETAAEAWFQLGTIHAQLRQPDKALRCYGTALPYVRRHGLADIEASLLANRGLINFHRRRYNQSLADLERAEQLYDDLGEHASRHRCMGNRAMTLFRLGSLPEALALFDRTERDMAALGIDPARIDGDRCESLMAAGMFEEALARAQSASRFFARTGNTTRQIEALTFGAEAAELLGDTDLALRLADGALGLESAEHVQAMRARAELVQLRVRHVIGASLGTDGTDAERLAVDVGAAAPSVSITATLLAADIAVSAGGHDHARTLLKSVESRVRRSRFEVQAHRWSVEARLRRSAQRDQAALRATAAGRRAVERLRHTAGSYEVRAHVGRHSEDLAGVEAAIRLERGEAAKLRGLLEEQRGGALRFIGRTSTTSPALDDAVTELRLAETGGERPGAVARLQRTVAALSQTESGVHHDLASGARLLPGEHELVYLDHDDRLWRIETTDATCDLHDCGPLGPVLERVERLSYCERQLARRGGLSETMVASLGGEHRTMSRELSRMLLPRSLGERVIVNPSPLVTSLSWAALDGLFERPHTIAPSRALTRRALPTRIDRVAVSATDELPFAFAEAGEVAAVHGVGGVEGEAALDDIGAAELWHAAGHFRSSGTNPLFAAVDLGARTINGYELLHAGTSPTIAVLSACNSAWSGVVGAEQVGFATALLACGTSAVIVTQETVEDSPAMVRAMTGLHRRLADGSPPAEALLEVRASSPATDRALVGTFSCLGTGW